MIGSPRTSVAVPSAFHRYLHRRSALELVVLDAFAVVGGLVMSFPRALAGERPALLLLLALSPGLMFVARSLVAAVHVPGGMRLDQLDPRMGVTEHRLLDEARVQALVGFGLLALTVVAGVLLGLR